MREKELMNMSNTMNNSPKVLPAGHVEQHTDQPLKQYVLDCSRAVLQRFRDEIDGRVYEVVLAAMEQPLLLAVIEECRGNQTKAARMLTLSRGTLRKKLKTYAIDKRSSPEAGEPANELERTLAPMRSCVLQNVRRYLANMRGQTITKMYNMVLAEIEEPLLTAVMEDIRDNQTRAAKMMGLSRGTLRKKIKIYGIERR
jgi:Fis family transcriptional regulator, factor for inversion stimulation protein